MRERECVVEYLWVHFHVSVSPYDRLLILCRELEQMYFISWCIDALNCICIIEQASWNASVWLGDSFLISKRCRCHRMQGWWLKMNNTAFLFSSKFALAEKHAQMWLVSTLPCLWLGSLPAYMGRLRIQHSLLCARICSFVLSVPGDGWAFLQSWDGARMFTVLCGCLEKAKHSGCAFQEWGFACGRLVFHFAFKPLGKLLYLPLDFYALIPWHPRR